MKLLVLATVAALCLANSPAHEAYMQLWQWHLGPWPLKEWINEGLMSIFFFAIGCELREMPRKEFAKPALAALGGMIFPALIYIAINHDPATIKGWGIPVATDIVFAVSALKFLGRERERKFLLALAVFDDLGAVAIIALVYAGFHLAVVGFILGLLIGRPHVQKFSDLVIVPLFAFANAGVSFAAAGVTRTGVNIDSVAVGIALALAFGKPIGILIGAKLAGRGTDRRENSSRHLGVAACLGGVGFTMSIFVSELAFPGSDSPKLGIIVGSILSFAFAFVVSKVNLRTRPV